MAPKRARGRDTSWKTQRIADAVVLRSQGVHDIGNNDGFIQIVCARFVGGVSEAMYSFDLKSKNGQYASKQNMNGRGSRTLERLLRKSCVPQHTFLELRKLTRERLPGDHGERTNLLKELVDDGAPLYL